VNRLLRDCLGASLMEFTVVFPVFILITFGTVDVTYMLFDWALANKAAYVGAHRAIVSGPIASGLTNPTYDATKIGLMCFDPAFGTPNANCPLGSLATTCTPSSGTGGSCTNGFAFDNAAFNCIFDPRSDVANCAPAAASGAEVMGMHDIFPKLQRQNVRISYQPANLGFVGRPGGLPMNVTVSISGMTHEMYFIGPIMGFFGGGFAANPPIPAFATTLPSEDMASN
jgi:TadE-like protein